MEELRDAIGAMKHAEEALLKKGFILRWKIRVKADRGFLRNIATRLAADAEATVGKPVRTRKAAREAEAAVPGMFTSVVKTKTVYKKPRPRKAAPEQATPASAPEAEEQNPEAVVDEAMPTTAFDTSTAASYLGISTAGVFDLVKRGRLPIHGQRGKRWFRVEDLDQYIESRNKRKAG